MKALQPAFIAFVLNLTLPALADMAEPIATDDSFFRQTTSRRSLKIMSYNLHNLFDTLHDSDYFDYTFLPLDFPKKQERCQEIDSRYYRNLCKRLDWVPNRLMKKLKQIRKIIHNHGDIPDLLAIQEIENENIAQKLADFLGYDQFVVTDQPSRRGIDVGLLWNQEKIQFIDYQEIAAKLRSPLRMHFKIRKTNEDFFVYINHWPAQSAPTSWRLSSAQALQRNIDEILEDRPEALILVLGDLNIAPEEEQEVLGQTLLSRKWKHQLQDLHQLSRGHFPRYREKFPEGTYWYHRRNQWQRFDRILVSKSLREGASQVEVSSYRIIYSKFITRYKTIKNQKGDPIKVRIPSGYNFLENNDSKLGYSDHLPISTIINY